MKAIFPTFTHDVCSFLETMLSNIWDEDSYPVPNPNSVLYLGRPDEETEETFPLPLPPVAVFSRDNEPPVLATFITDIVRRPPKYVGEPGGIFLMAWIILEFQFTNF